MTLQVPFDERENLQKYLIFEKTAHADGIGWKKAGKVAEILCFLLLRREEA